MKILSTLVLFLAVLCLTNESYANMIVFSDLRLGKKDCGIDSPIIAKQASVIESVNSFVANPTMSGVIISESALNYLPDVPIKFSKHHIGTIRIYLLIRKGLNSPEVKIGMGPRFSSTWFTGFGHQQSIRRTWLPIEHPNDRLVALFLNKQIDGIITSDLTSVQILIKRSNADINIEKTFDEELFFIGSPPTKSCRFFHE